MRFPSLNSYQRKCARIDRIENWHRWFAWYPVRVSTWERAWLETVERKGTWWAQLGWTFEYLAIPVPRGQADAKREIRNVHGVKEPRS